MPFVAKRGDRKIAPVQADSDDVMICPACREALSVRRSHYRDGTFVARHFWHPDGGNGGGVGGGDDGGCGGESDEHKRMKSIAASKSLERWPDATVSLEAEVGYRRRADVLVDFKQANERFGEGIAIEVQHKNDYKNVDQVTDDYLYNDYSVLWLFDANFDGRNVNLGEGEWVVWWTREVPAVDEWTGYHNIVRWLRQDKSVSVNIDLPFPQFEQFPREQWLKAGWARGIMQSAKYRNETVVIAEGRVFGAARLELVASSTGGINLKLRKGLTSSSAGPPKAIHSPLRQWTHIPESLERMATYIEEWNERLIEPSHTLFQMEGMNARMIRGWTDIISVSLSKNRELALKCTPEGPDGKPVLAIQNTNYESDKYLAARVASKYAPETLREIADVVSYIYTERRRA